MATIALGLAHAAENSASTSSLRISLILRERSFATTLNDVAPGRPVHAAGNDREICSCSHPTRRAKVRRKRGEWVSIYFIFLVAGTNGKPKDLFSDEATTRAKAWVKRLVDERKTSGALAVAGDFVRFLRFKAEDSSVRVAELALKAKAADIVTDLKWTKLSAFSGSGGTTYDPSNILVMPVGGDTLGMPHIYQSVRKAPAKSILELGVLSHAWFDGPVLQIDSPINDDFPPAPDPTTGLLLRNKGDKQGRVRTDFFANMGEDPAGIGKDALKEFVAAFSPKGAFYVFGCDGQDGPRVPTLVPGNAKNPSDPAKPPFTAQRPHLKSTAGEVIHQAYVKPLKDDARGEATAAVAAYAKILRGKTVANTTDVTIDMRYEFKDEVADIVKRDGHYNVIDMDDLRTLHYGLDPKFFPPAPAPTTANPSPIPPFKFTKHWDQLLGFVARQMQIIYGFQAALALTPLGVTVFTGAPGTKAKDDKSGQMAVCGGEASSECIDVVEFYKRFVGSVDDRRYFVLDTAGVARINALALVL